MSDVGLNGLIVHGVFTTKPDRAAVDNFTHAQLITRDGFHYRVASLTGYAGTEILEMGLNHFNV